MAGFGTFRNARREPAVPLRPIVDPAGWEPEELLAADDWSYRFSDDDVAEIAEAVEAVRRAGVALVDLQARDFPLPRLGALLRDVRSELLHGRGIAVLRGLPVARMGRDWSATAYLGLGVHIGKPNSQNAFGHLLGHVRDFGRDYEDPNYRGYQSAATIEFHCDHSDFVGLLCMQPAKSGGESRVASAVTLYNRMVAARPDLVEALMGDFYFTRHGEIPPGADPWKIQPVIGFADGYFSARGASHYIFKAQSIPGVPKLTERQLDALKYYREVVAQCAVDLVFEQGDIQLLHNNVMQHSRRAFTDWPEPERKRHLYRLWLNAGKDARPLPKSLYANFQGIYVAGATPQVVIDPAEAEEAAA